MLAFLPTVRHLDEKKKKDTPVFRGWGHNALTTEGFLWLWSSNYWCTKASLWRSGGAGAVGDHLVARDFHFAVDDGILLVLVIGILCESVGVWLLFSVVVPGFFFFAFLYLIYWF